MLAVKLCRLPTVRSLVSPQQVKFFQQPVRNAASQKTRIGRLPRRSVGETIKQTVATPAGESAFSLGKGAIAGASLVGLGALCYYGMGMSSELGAIDRATLWPPIVKERIRDTYMYFAGSIGITAASALAVVKRSPKILEFMMKNSLIGIGATFALMIGSGMVCRSLPYEEGFGAKQIAWLVHSGIMGAVVAPVCLLGGPLLVRAAWYTAGVVGGLSTVAICAPSEKFLNMGGPLAIGLGVVFVSSLGSMFLPPTTALGAGLYSMSIYGGLILFSMFLLYDTQKIIKSAEMHPVYAMQKYDPINRSIGIYLDTLNIFMRIATILAGGGNRRR
ncbi:growth hormone-inducible transmembrane protein-like [Tubulanus polymorphus]|uniref:growth hormone-inducible transmembrane protein-like n=1 Tax=Tubulanus polymorphus TaxID=672921 RepID=UPI003DA63D85